MVLAAVGGLISACGGSSDSISADSACDEWSQVTCQKLAQCAPSQAQFYGTEADCVRILKRICPQSFGLPGSGDSPAATAACSKVTQTLSCETFNGQADYCPIKGTLADGTACNQPAQCASGYCRVPSAGGCGVCGARSAQGGACESSFDCGDNLACLFDGAKNSGACVRSVGAGAACGLGAICQAGLFCGQDGTCLATSKENDACATTDACDSDQGLECGADGKCHQQPAAAPGTSCAPNGGIDPVCTGGLCNTTSMKCEAYLTEGDPCDANASFLCELGLTCVAGKCSPPHDPICR